MIRVNIISGILLVLFGVINFIYDYHLPSYTGEYLRDSVFTGAQMHGMSKEEVQELAKVKLHFHNDILLEIQIGQRLNDYCICDYVGQLESNYLFYNNLLERTSSGELADPHLDSEALYDLNNTIENMKSKCNE